MNILSIENLSKSYGEKILFENVSLGIDTGDKVGLIGVNGTGKSTFLKVIAGLDTPDGGKVTLASSAHLEYLPQNPEFTDGGTVLEQVFRGHSRIMKVLRDYERTLAKANLHPADSECQQQLIRLSQQMDELNAWQLEHEAKTVLTKLGIEDFEADTACLSGGQRKRVALAGALIQSADLLILDEPTNHIDTLAVAWLEQYLATYKGALLMITHDRYFLDRVANRTIEIDKGKLYRYDGNYSKFLELKADREEREENSERKRRNLLRTELAWMRQGAQARSTKQKARIERFEALSDQKGEVRPGKLEMDSVSTRLGRKIVELNGITQQFGGRRVIDNYSYIVLRNDRVGIVGPNGSGKSTLLNIVAGRLQPDEGMLETGQTVKIGYFSQENSDMDEALRVIDYIREEAHQIITADGSTISASAMLERFLFPPNVQWMPIAKLSGGEKRRLYLLRILMGAPNVLLLDEPTNDLDIQTLAILEDYLDDFQGAVIAVSHDRYFLDRIVDKVFAFEGNGLIREYPGGYSDYLARKQMDEAASALRSQPDKIEKAPAVREEKKARKLSYNEQREYDQIEGKIAAAEAELQQVAAGIENSGSDFERLQQLTARQKELEAQLDELLERWSYLTEIAEEMTLSGR